MIYTVYSNAYEVLRLILLHNLKAQRDPHTSVRQLFEKTPILVPSQAIGEDLAREMAQTEGICAGWEFLRASSWMGFSSVATTINVVGNEIDWMIWRLLSETGRGSFREHPEHQRLKHYLDGKNALEIFAFARRIAGVFMVYATHRADWVFRWLDVSRSLLGDEGLWKRELNRLETSPDYRWQVHLWQALAENPQWRGLRFMEAFGSNLEKLARAPRDPDGGNVEIELDEGRRITLTNTLHVFLPFTIPPMLLPVLKALLLSDRDVWFYVLNPSDAYWFDSASAVQRLEAKTGEASPIAIEGGDIHPLLAANAASTRVTIDRLWQFANEEASVPYLSERNDTASAPRPSKQEKWDLARFKEIHQKTTLDMDMASERQSVYIERNGEGLLARLQDSLLNNDPNVLLTESGDLGLRDDDSLRIWNAPTETRQWEAIRNAIETLFANDATLKPSDIVVVTPDVSKVAPLVEKVFGALPESRRFPWRITGLTSLSVDEPVQALKLLAKLMTERADRDTFEAWLGLAPIARRFNLTSDELGIVANWLRAAGYREGLSDAHLMQLNPEVFAYDREMNLLRALERLTLGYLLPDDEGLPLVDVLPKRGNEGEGFETVYDRWDLLETLQGIALTLEAFRQETGSPKTAQAWGQWVMKAYQAFFEETALARQVKAALEALEVELTLASDTPETPMSISFALYMHALLIKLDTAHGPQAALANVTVSSMELLRGLPHRVVFIAGLDADYGFPGNSIKEEFDLTAIAPRRGDRDARRDRRNLFLDWILAARDRLIVTYVSSAKPSEAAVMQPSVVVQELRDWLLNQVPDTQTREEDAKRLTESIPLTEFERTNFERPSEGCDPLWRSHNERILSARLDAQAGQLVPYAHTALKETRIALGDRPAGWQLDDEGVLRLPLKVLADFMRDPRVWVAKALELLPPGDPSADADGVWPQLDGLSAWKVKDNYARALRAGEAPESIALRDAYDVSTGAKEARRWLTESLRTQTATAHAVFEAMTRDYSREAPKDFQLSLFEGKVILTGYFHTFYRNEHDRVMMEFFSGTKPSAESVLTNLAAAALGEGVRTEVVCCDQTMATQVLEPDSAEMAKGKLEQAVRALLAVCANPRLAPKSAYATELNLYFGDAQDDSVPESPTAASVITKMFKAKADKPKTRRSQSSPWEELWAFAHPQGAVDGEDES